MTDTHPIRGLYENCIGVPDLIFAIRFWGQFGYRIVDQGELDQGASNTLYKVDSAVESVRLRHGRSDHSYVRLMQWDTPRNPGIGITKTLRQDGGRWGVLLTRSVLNILNHVEDAQAKGEPWNYIFPHWLQVYAMDKGSRSSILRLAFAKVLHAIRSGVSRCSSVTITRSPLTA